MKSIKFIFISMLSFFVLSIGMMAQSSPKAEPGKVESNQVCFVNNKFMNKDQIPVIVEGKTYYGCCQGCVTNLQNNRETRFATDPFTKEEVDKATAFIVIKAGTKDDVQYFKSRKNSEDYQAKIK